MQIVYKTLQYIERSLVWKIAVFEKRSAQNLSALENPVVKPLYAQETSLNPTIKYYTINLTVISIQESHITSYKKARLKSGSRTAEQQNSRTVAVVVVVVLSKNSTKQKKSSKAKALTNPIKSI